MMNNTPVYEVVKESHSARIAEILANQALAGERQGLLAERRAELRFRRMYLIRSWLYRLTPSLAPRLVP